MHGDTKQQRNSQTQVIPNPTQFIPLISLSSFCSETKEEKLGHENKNKLNCYVCVLGLIVVKAEKVHKASNWRQVLFKPKDFWTPRASTFYFSTHKKNCTSKVLLKLNFELQRTTFHFDRYSLNSLQN